MDRSPLSLVRAVLASRWLPAAAIAVAALVLVQRLDAGRRAALELAAAKAEIARAAEAGRLEEQGFASAARLEAAVLRREAGATMARYADVAAEVERLRKAARSRPVAVLGASTGPIVVARPPEAPASPGGPPRAPECVLSVGDQGEVRLAGVIEETRAGNLVPVLRLECWRTGPAPALLFGGLARPDLSRFVVERPPSPAAGPGWGWGAVWLGGRRGWLAGPAVSAPPLRLWLWQVDVTGGVAFGPAGEWATSLAGVVRGR